VIGGRGPRPPGSRGELFTFLGAAAIVIGAVSLSVVVIVALVRFLTS
jgi:hypothetical protein